MVEGVMTAFKAGEVFIWLLSMHTAIANHAHGNAFDGEGFAARVDYDGFEIRVGGQQFNQVAALLCPSLG